MKLETPKNDEFGRFVRNTPGCEMLATFRGLDGSTKQFDLVALLLELHRAIHAMHHFIDPTGPRNDAFKSEPLYVTTDDNPTGRARSECHSCRGSRSSRSCCAAA